MNEASDNALPSETSANPIRQIREALGFDTQSAFADAIEVKAQHVSRAEGRATLSPQFEKRIRAFVETLEPETQRRVLDLLDARVVFGRDALEGSETSTDKNAWASPVPDPAEPEVWSWCLTSRNKTLLEETAGQALRSGRLACELKHDALVLTEKTSSRAAKPRTEGLVADPSEFGLHAGTVLILGISKRHSLAARLLFHFNKLLEPPVEIREFLEHPYRYAYFGYPTVLKYLRVQGKYYRPERYAEKEAMVYKDVVAIFHAPFSRLSGNYSQVFGKQSKRLLWVAALQRLGNGVAVQTLLRDAVARRRWAKKHKVDYDFEGDRHPGGAIFEVTVANDGYGTTLRSLDLLKILKPASLA
jgi:hypothetical protein